MGDNHAARVKQALQLFRTLIVEPQPEKPD
jgi:hypothetical protein